MSGEITSSPATCARRPADVWKVSPEGAPVRLPRGAVARENLTSRERVVRTLRREPVDRVPIDLGSHMSTGISAFAYWNLRRHLGLATDRIWIPDLVQFLAFVDEDVRARFHADCILLEPPWEQTVRWIPRGSFAFTVPSHFAPEKDAGGDWIARQGGKQMRMPAGGYFFDGEWLNDWGRGSEEQRIGLYAREAERLFKETPYAMNFVGYSRGIGHGAFFGGLEQAVRMISDPREVLEENELACERMIARFRSVNAAMGSYIQLLTVGDDMGTQQGPLCNPLHIERFCMPYYRRFCRVVHAESDIKVFMHNCGAIRSLIPMLIEAGIDALNPVQISAAGMDSAELKAEFGDRITFWGGGCDTQKVLPTASPGEVARHVARQVGILKSRGGFVFTQVHNIMGNVPPENIVAMFDAAYQEGWY
jgi:uroporphyrinogen decarboxylase